MSIQILKKWHEYKAIHFSAFGSQNALTLFHSESAADIAELEAKLAESESKVYVPGLWRCAKCKFSLISTTLHIENGMMSANNSPQQCANGCGPMWRVTERDSGNELVDRLEASEAKLAACEKEKNDALSSLVNMVGVFHSPVRRLKYPTEFGDEACRIAKAFLDDLSAKEKQP